MSKPKYTLNTNDGQREIYNILKQVPRIAELDLPANVVDYSEASIEEVLNPIVEAHQVIMVAGAFFGDEGKGKTVDAVIKHPQVNIVARTNSGENAGHTVFDESGQKYVFNLCPSGLLVPNKRNFVGAECVMDPISFMNKEIAQLITHKKPYDLLFIGNVHIVTPYHKLLDMLTSAVNSSTLKGMSPIHASKVTKRGIRLDHIFGDPEVMRARLKKDMDTYFGVLKLKNLTDADVVARCAEENSDGVVRIPPYVVDFAQAADKVEYLIQLYDAGVKNNALFPKRCDVAHEIRATLAKGEKVLLEGPQSYWLSNARDKFWESSTSADTSAGGLLATAQYNFQKYPSVVINVHKTPGCSRVGVGANPSAYVPQDYFSAQNIRTLRDLPEGMCTDFDAVQKIWGESVRENGTLEPVEYTDATGTYSIGTAMSIASARHHGETGSTTQKPRITGLFDCVAHFEVNAAQGPYLTISALDRGDDYDKVGMTIAYIYCHPQGLTLDSNGRQYTNGTVIKAGDPYPSEAILYYCYPIIKLINGWKESPIAATVRKPGTPFPLGLKQFLTAVEFFTQAKIISIGNGPKGSNILYIKS